MSDQLICERCREALVEWLDGTLDSEHAHDVSQHVEQCPSCAAEYAALKELFATVRDEPPLDDEVESGARVLAEIEQRVGERSNRLRLHRYALAAVILLCLAATAALLRTDLQPTRRTERQPVPLVLPAETLSDPLAPFVGALFPLPAIDPAYLPKEEQQAPANEDVDQIGQHVINALQQLMENPQVAAEYETEDTAYDVDPLPADLSDEELERLEQALGELLLFYPKKG